MADEVTGMRLKKKVLDRWENEGGRIVADPAGADECGSKSNHGGEFDRLSGAFGNSVGRSPTKGRKPAVK